MSIIYLKAEKKNKQTHVVRAIISSRFTDAETEAQRGDVICLKPHGLQAGLPGRFCFSCLGPDGSLTHWLSISLCAKLRITVPISWGLLWRLNEVTAGGSGPGWPVPASSSCREPGVTPVSAPRSLLCHQATPLLHVLTFPKSGSVLYSTHTLDEVGFLPESQDSVSSYKRHL